MEIDVERSERITAPLQLVWDETDSLEKLLAKTPQAFTYEVLPGGQRATAMSRLAWGPIKWSVDVEVSIEEYRPLEQIAYCVSAPSLALRFQGVIDLIPVGERETRLDYRGHLDVGHQYVSRMRGLFNDITEEHVCGLIGRVKVKAEQRRLAQERLLQ